MVSQVRNGKLETFLFVSMQQQTNGGYGKGA